MQVQTLSLLFVIYVGTLLLAVAQDGPGMGMGMPGKLFGIDTFA